DQLYMITRSVMDRRHWLDERDRNAVALFKFVLALACGRFAMRAVKIVFMRNHIHMLVHDKEGRISQFQRYFFWLTAVKMNRYLGRSGTFWINDGRETVVVADEAAAVRKAVYIALNPVAGGYTQDPDEWGLNVMPGDLDQPAKTVKRPKTFFGERSRVPKSVQLEFLSPPGHEEFPAKVQAGIEMLLPLAKRFPRRPNRMEKGFTP